MILRNTYVQRKPLTATGVRSYPVCYDKRYYAVQFILVHNHLSAVANLNKRGGGDPNDFTSPPHLSELGFINSIVNISK
jgi:hypothetical protein